MDILEKERKMAELRSFQDNILKELDDFSKIKKVLENAEYEKRLELLRIEEMMKDSSQEQLEWRQNRKRELEKDLKGINKEKEVIQERRLALTRRFDKLSNAIRLLEEQGDNAQSIEKQRTDTRMDEAFKEVYQIWKKEMRKPKNKRQLKLQGLCGEAIEKYFPEIPKFQGVTKYGREKLTDEFKKKRDAIRSRVNQKFIKRRRRGM